MNYEITSIGDPAFLQNVLWSVSSIFGRGDFTVLIMIAFLMGALAVGIQTILGGGLKIEAQNIAAAVLIYALAFGSTVEQVDIYSFDDLSIRQVPDVPLGLAVTGTMISSIGTTITRWFETEFQTPTQPSTQYGSGAALKSLYLIRGLTFGDGSLGWDPEGNVTRSVRNYLVDCAKPGSSLPTSGGGSPAISESAFLNADLAWEELEWQNNVYATLVVNQGGERELMGCHDAYQYITNNYFTSDMVSQWLASAGQRMQREGILVTGDKFDPDNFNDVAEVNNFYEDAINDLLNISMDLDRLFYNRIIIGAYSEALDDRSEVGSGDLMFSRFKQLTTTELSFDWAGQQAVFERMMRPMMAYFEAIMYVAAPFAAFLLAFGIGGLSMVGKYLMFALWIQLWMPLMAVSDLFIQMAAERSLHALDGPALGQMDAESIHSISQQPQVFMELSNWIGVGGLLSAATPAIALMLIYGSAVTASSLAGRVSESSVGANPGESEKAQHHIGGYQAQLNRDGLNTIGYQQSTDAGRWGQFNVGEDVSNAQEASEQRLAAVQEDYRQQLAAHRQQTAQFMESAATENVSTNTDTYGTTGTRQLSNDVVETSSHTQSLSESEREAITGALNGQLTGSISGGAGRRAMERSLLSQADTGQARDHVRDQTRNMSPTRMAMISRMLGGEIKADLSGSYQERFDQANEQAARLEEKYDQVWKENESELTQAREEASVSTSGKDTYQDQWAQIESSAEQLSSTRSDVESAQSSVSELSRLSSNVRYDQTIQGSELQAIMGAAPERMQQYRSHVGNEEAGVSDYMRDVHAARQQAATTGNVDELNTLLSFAGYNLASGDGHNGFSPSVDRDSIGFGANPARGQVPESTDIHTGFVREHGDTHRGHNDDLVNDARAQDGWTDPNVRPPEEGPNTERLMERGERHGITPDGNWGRSIAGLRDFMSSEDFKKKIAGATSGLEYAGQGGEVGAVVGAAAGAYRSAVAASQGQRAAVGAAMRAAGSGAVRGGMTGGVWGAVGWGLVGVGVGYYQYTSDRNDERTAAFLNYQQQLHDHYRGDVAGIDPKRDDGAARDVIETTLAGVTAMEASARIAAGDRFDEGKFLSGLNDFEQAVYQQRDQLSQLYGDSVDQRINGGDLGDAAKEAWQDVGVDPDDLGYLDRHEAKQDYKDKTGR